MKNTSFWCCCVVPSDIKMHFNSTPMKFKRSGSFCDIGQRSIVRNMFTFLKDFSSQATGPIAIKFHRQPPSKVCAGGGGRGEREKEKICILGCTERIVSALFETGKEAPVAQWVKCWPTDLAVASSSSAWGEIFSTLLVRIPLHTAFYYQPLIVLI